MQTIFKKVYKKESFLQNSFFIMIASSQRDRGDKKS